MTDEANDTAARIIRDITAAARRAGEVIDRQAARVAAASAAAGRVANRNSTAPTGETDTP